jgi:hypothetical protein
MSMSRAVEISTMGRRKINTHREKDRMSSENKVNQRALRKFWLNSGKKFVAKLFLGWDYELR